VERINVLPTSTIFSRSMEHLLLRLMFLRKPQLILQYYCGKACFIPPQHVFMILNDILSRLHHDTRPRFASVVEKIHKNVMHEAKQIFILNTMVKHKMSGIPRCKSPKVGGWNYSVIILSTSKDAKAGEFKIKGRVSSLWTCWSLVVMQGSVSRPLRMFVFVQFPCTSMQEGVLQVY
jgi:hypothetical protein